MFATPSGGGYPCRLQRSRYTFRFAEYSGAGARRALSVFRQFPPRKQTVDGQDCESRWIRAIFRCGINLANYMPVRVPDIR